MAEAPSGPTVSTSVMPRGAYVVTTHYAVCSSAPTPLGRVVQAAGLIAVIAVLCLVIVAAAALSTSLEAYTRFVSGAEAAAHDAISAVAKRAKLAVAKKEQRAAQSLLPNLRPPPPPAIPGRRA